MNQIYCTKAFDTIDLDDDIIPFKPTCDDFRQMTKNNLLEYARVLGKKFNKSMPKDSMTKLLMKVRSEEDKDDTDSAKDDSDSDKGKAKIQDSWKNIVGYMWAEEKKNWRECEKPQDHIYQDFKTIDKFIFGNEYISDSDGEEDSDDEESDHHDDKGKGSNEVEDKVEEDDYIIVQKFNKEDTEAVHGDKFDMPMTDDQWKGSK